MAGKAHPAPAAEEVTGTTDEGKVAAMITVSVEVRTGRSTRTVKMSAPSIRRALELAGEGSAGTQARVLFPIDGDGFFAGSKDAPELLHAAASAAAA